MADKRLQDIRTSDDAESTVNVELIEWLKTSGVNYLLFILVIVIVFRGWLWWGERRERISDEAWADLVGTDTAASLEALADRAAGIDSVPELALLRAADLYQLDILRDQTLDLVPDEPAMDDPNRPDSESTDDEPKVTPRMTEQERTQTLDRMQRIYQRVYDSTADRGSGANWKELLHIRAMFGLAAVAEMRGQAEEAQQWYAKIDAAARPRYAELGEVALAWKNHPEALMRIEFPEESVVNKALRDPPAAAAPVEGESTEPPSEAAPDDATKTEPAGESTDQPADPPADEPGQADEPAPGGGG